MSCTTELGPDEQGTCSDRQTGEMSVYLYEGGKDFGDTPIDENEDETLRNCTTGNKISARRLGDVSLQDAHFRWAGIIVVAGRTDRGMPNYRLSTLDKVGIDDH